MTLDNPFTPLPAPESILETLGFTEALRRLGENLGAREPFLLITGEPGMGKTALAQLAIARWGSKAAVARLALPLHNGVELLEEILHRLGAESPDAASRPKLVARFEAVLGETASRDQVVVIVVDDAHHLSSELLEELRLLVSSAQHAGRRIEVLLLGPPSLEERLEQPALAPLRQRVSVRAQLAPLSGGETRRYIRHRLAAAGLDGAKVFSRKTCAEIASQSRGVPREINAIAAEAMRMARAAGSASVEPNHVREALATLSGALPKGDTEEVGDIAETVAEAVVVVKSEPRKAAPAAAPPSAAFAPAAPAPAAPTAPSAPPAPRANAAPPSTPAKASTPATSPPSVPPPGDPSRVRDSAPGEEEFSKPTPAPPANYTPSEWVARFVGDKGPLQLSTQAMPRPSRAPEVVAANEAAPAEAEEAAPRAPSAIAAALRLPRRRRDLRLPLAAAAAAVVGVVVIGLIVRVIAMAQHGGAKPATAATASVAPTEEPESPHATSPGSPHASPSSATRASEKNEPASQAASAIPRGPYTLETNSLHDYTGALDERTRVQALTGIEGWVAPAGEEHPNQYRVLLGVFSSYSHAQSAAAMLMRSHTLPHVTVVKLPSKRVRQ